MTLHRPRPAVLEDLSIFLQTLHIIGFMLHKFVMVVGLSTLSNSLSKNRCTHLYYIGHALH